MFVNKYHTFQLYFYALKSFATVKKKETVQSVVKQIVLSLLKCFPTFITKAVTSCKTKENSYFLLSNNQQWWKKEHIFFFSVMFLRNYSQFNYSEITLACELMYFLINSSDHMKDMSCLKGKS